MKRKYLLLSFVSIVSGLILFGSGWLLMGSHNSSSGNSSNSSKMELAPFQNLEISVMSADVTITEGDTYSVEYRLHGREKVERLEVVNDTLYFDTGFDLFWKPTGGHWSVRITVPEGTEFETVSLKSTSGDIHFSGYSFENGIFNTTSGDVTVSEVDCKTLSINTVSHDISLANSTVSDEAALETVSGNISVDAPFGTIQAKSVGNIKYNGADQGGKFSIDQGHPDLIAKSVSGKIIINTK